MRTSFAAAVLVLTCALVPAGAAAAGSARTADMGSACTTRVEMPSRISIDRSYREVPVILRSTCPGLDWAATDVYGPDGLEDVLIWDPAEDGGTDYFDFYAGWTPLGSYKTRDGVAYDNGSTELDVTETATSVRLRSRAGLTTSRSGNYVTLRGSVQRYSPTYDQYRPWNTVARIDRQTATGWSYVRTLDLGSDGVATTKLYAPKAATYRLRVTHQATTWGVMSASTRR